jgi:hypothetical protein
MAGFSIVNPEVQVFHGKSLVIALYFLFPIGFFVLGFILCLVVHVI